jgi:hypothetical protein
MAKIAKVKATLKDAADVRTVWEMIPSLQLGSTSLNDYITSHDATDGLHKDYGEKDLELTALKKKRDDGVRQLQDLVTRFRSAVRGSYGPDSPEYTLAGGTPSSARKSPKRKAAAASTASTASSSDASKL